MRSWRVELGDHLLYNGHVVGLTAHEYGFAVVESVENDSLSRIGTGGVGGGEQERGVVAGEGEGVGLGLGGQQHFSTLLRDGSLRVAQRLLGGCQLGGEAIVLVLCLAGHGSFHGRGRV